MTTNQTIDGVPRELIARAVTAAHIADCPSLRDELRALLDAPAINHDQKVSDHQFYTEQLQTRAAKMLGLNPENTSWFEVVGEIEKAALPKPDPVLCKFYDVTDYLGLVRELVGHVAQLQDSAKRNVKPWEDTFPPTLLPAYIERVNSANASAQPQGEPVAKSQWDVSSNPVLGYADSYRAMARQGVQTVSIWSVITDLERNIAPLYASPPRSTELLALLRQVIENEEGFAFDHDLLARIKVAISDRTGLSEIVDDVTYPPGMEESHKQFQKLLLANGATFKVEAYCSLPRRFGRYWPEQVQQQWEDRVNSSV